MADKYPTLKLTGERNRCPCCREIFNSTYAFEEHRTGNLMERTRRCLSTKEMRRRGMRMNEAGLWITGRAWRVM